jgi:hypothetical protein
MRRMKIAFDLDNTLIQYEYAFSTETPKKKLFAKLFGAEALRLGTVELFHFCQKQNWETWIYTTSFRSKVRIKTLFWVHNIALNGVINQTIHNKKVTVRSSKHPPTFGIDVLIDDSEGVQLEGERFGFEVIVVKPDNDDWVKELKTKLTEINLHITDKKGNFAPVL